MNVEYQRMSPEEAQFVKLYALTIKKHYDEFFNALQMMRSEIGIKCPVQAALLGRQLHEIGADFEHELALIANRHNARMRDLPKMPTTAELVKLVQVSFFKLVDPQDDPPDDKGWFSGHPFEWDATYKKIQQVYKAQSPAPPLSMMLQAFLKLFNNVGDLQIDITEFNFKNFLPYKSEMHQQYDDEYYDDYDEDDNDFDYYADED
jgi:hypothetical protein